MCKYLYSRSMVFTLGKFWSLVGLQRKQNLLSTQLIMSINCIGKSYKKYKKEHKYGEFKASESYIIIQIFIIIII